MSTGCHRLPSAGRGAELSRGRSTGRQQAAPGSHLWRVCCSLGTIM